MKPYVFVVPHYAHQSAGIRYIHNFCSELNNSGYEAYITGENSPSSLNVRHLSELDKQSLEYIRNDGIVVYPEIIDGNPLQFRNVVRWDLAPPIYDYLPTDTVFVYGKILQSKSVGKHLLEIYYIEDFFNLPEHERRILKVFWVGKSPTTPRVPETTGCVEITYAAPSTRTALASLLKSSSILYTYDNFTGLILEARLCGCPVVVIPSNQITIEDTRYRHPFGNEGLFIYGDNYTESSLRHGIENIRRRFDEFKVTTEKSYIENFIEVTQKLDNTYQEHIKSIDPNFLSWVPIDKFTK